MERWGGIIGLEMVYGFSYVDKLNDMLLTNEIILVLEI